MNKNVALTLNTSDEEKTFVINREWFDRYLKENGLSYEEFMETYTSEESADVYAKAILEDEIIKCVPTKNYLLGKAIEFVENTRVQTSRSANQDNTITPSHTRFNFVLNYKGNIYRSTYQCNTNYMKPNKEDIIFACLSDSKCYSSTCNEQDFANELGYEVFSKEFNKAYKGCKRAYEFFSEILSEDELHRLIDYLQ